MFLVIASLMIFLRDPGKKKGVVSAGALGEEIEIIAQRLQTVDGPKTQTVVGQLLEALRNE